MCVIVWPTRSLHMHTALCYSWVFPQDRVLWVCDFEGKSRSSNLVWIFLVLGKKKPDLQMEFIYWFAEQWSQATNDIKKYTHKCFCRRQRCLWTKKRGVELTIALGQILTALPSLLDFSFIKISLADLAVIAPHGILGTSNHLYFFFFLHFSN